MGRMRAGVVSAALMLAAAVIVLPVQAANGQSPSTTVVLPAYSASISGTTEYFDAIASAGATKVTFELSGGPSDLSDVQITTGTATIYGWLAAWNSTTVSNGSYTLNSVAAYSGGVSATSTSVPLTVNNPPPSTTVVFPASGATLNGSQTQFIDAVASPGVTEVTIDLTGQGGPPSLTLRATPTLVGWIGVLPGGSGSCGPIALSYSIQSVATYAGGVSATSASVPITLDAYTSFPGDDGC
jgi:hypothetical protein